MVEEPRDGVVIPVAEEKATLSKRVVEETVRVRVATDVERVVLRETLRGRRVEVERVEVGRMLDEGEPPPQPRDEDGTLIVPVVEERAVVVKRLVLREEVRRRFVPIEESFAEEVALRRQKVTVERGAPPVVDATSTPTDRGSP
jgi:hypothetical protein